ncbi:hypothetical protein BASA61_005119 [Batrachochytrium salamandrivorans]|nr:hypothetical protein BASA61_005119 [Batrachochytrium salamandrivorans]
MKFSYIVASAFTAATVSISVFASPLPQGQNGYGGDSSSASDKAIGALLNSIVSGISGIVGVATKDNPNSDQIAEGSAQSTASILKAIWMLLKPAGIARGVQTGYAGMKDGSGKAKADVAGGVGQAIDVIATIGSGIAGSFGDKGSSQQQQDDQPQQGGQQQQNGQDDQDYQDYQRYKQQQGRQSQPRRTDFWNEWKW